MSPTRIAILLALFVFNINAVAQINTVMLNRMTPMSINPALTGNQNIHRFRINANGMPGRNEPQTIARFSYDLGLGNNGVGLDYIFIKRSYYYQVQIISALYARSIDVNKWKFSIGVQPAYERKMRTITPNPPYYDNNRLYIKHYVSLRSGISAERASWTIGLAFNHLPTNNFFDYSKYSDWYGNFQFHFQRRYDHTYKANLRVVPSIILSNSSRDPIIDFAIQHKHFIVGVTAIDSNVGLRASYISNSFNIGVGYMLFEYIHLASGLVDFTFGYNINK